MDALDQITVSDGEADVAVRLERADARDPGLIRDLLDIDLQSYAESTFSEHTAITLSRHAAIFMLKTGGRAIGSCVFVRDFERPEDAVLLATGVLPGWRGRGLGEWMVASALRELAVLGFDGVVLYVGARNQRAVKVYNDVGFRLVDNRPDPTDAEDRLLVLRADLAAARAGGWQAGRAAS